MPVIEGEILIDRPVEAVFDFVADERNEPTYNPEMVEVEKRTPGPVRQGTKWDAVMRTRGWVQDMQIEVTDYDRPRRLASWSTMPTGEVRGSLTFEPMGRGTRMHWSWQVRPYGVRRLFSPVVKLVGARPEPRIWTALKATLEQGR